MLWPIFYICGNLGPVTLSDSINVSHIVYEGASIQRHASILSVFYSVILKMQINCPALKYCAWALQATFSGCHHIPVSYMSMCWDKAVQMEEVPVLCCAHSTRLHSAAQGLLLMFILGKFSEIAFFSKRSKQGH